MIFLLILCGLVLGFRGKLVEIGLISFASYFERVTGMVVPVP
jgi:hypothetical protein